MQAVIRHMLAGAALQLLPASSWAQPCTHVWLRPDAISPYTYASGFLAIADDAEGPALFAEAELQFHDIGYARWNGRRWDLLTRGMPPDLNYTFAPLALDDGAGVHAYGVVGAPSLGGLQTGMFWWDRDQWRPTPPGFFERTTERLVQPFASGDDGTGTAIYGSEESFIVRWAGDHWVSIGRLQNSLNFWIWGLDAGDGPAIYVAGWFTGIEGVPNSSGIAKYQRGVWSPLGTGLVMSGGPVRAMAVFDDAQGRALYVAGFFTEAGGIPVPGIARWRSDHWEPLPSTPNGQVNALAVYDDGAGPALYAGGSFSFAGGVPVHDIAKFDGADWHALEAGGSPYVSAMAVWDDGRGPSLFTYTGSGNLGAGFVSTGGVNQYVGCARCYADVTNDQRLNISDFIAFLTRFAARDPYCNCNQDSSLDVLDFACFLGRFGQGCP